jgi:hypothetical protein
MIGKNSGGAHLYDTIGVLHGHGGRFKLRCLAAPCVALLQQARSGGHNWQ